MSRRILPTAVVTALVCGVTLMATAAEASATPITSAVPTAAEPARSASGGQLLAAGEQRAVPAPNDLGRGYLEYLPIGYDPAATWPLVVFLHGVGEVGNGSSDLDKVANVGLPRRIRDGADYPAIVLSPQTNVQNWPLSMIESFITAARQHYPVDPQRIYITGLSLGGGGAWLYAAAHPDDIAAVVPVCGFGSTAGIETLAGVPTWAFHNDGDPTVPYSATRSRLAAITGTDPETVRPNRSGTQSAYFDETSEQWVWRDGQAAPPSVAVNTTLTLYKSGSHDAWTAAYGNAAMWQWLWQQRAPVLRQYFATSTQVSAYQQPTTPTVRQFNDISAEAAGGTVSVAGRSLRFARTGVDSADNDAGITRSTDLAGPPSTLRISFDVGVSGWTVDTSQTNAVTLAVGRMAGIADYGSGEVAANTFQTISVNGRGTGNFTVSGAGQQSALLPANGSQHRVTLLLNKTAAAQPYQAPDGSLRSLQANRFALFVDTALVVDAAAANGSTSALTDLRLRFSAADNGTWTIDDFNVYPQLLPPPTATAGG